MFAIVDIETTGGHAASNGVTEVAIILHNGRTEEGRFHSLINPGLPIPPYIVSLTGISDEMVAGAPTFSALAPRIFKLLENRVFVAHNVNFDYSFIRHHLSVSGFTLQTKKLCTVRLSRKIFKGLPSYSLGNLCRSLGISITGRHRAMGDATATALLFERMIQQDQEGHVTQMLKQGSREHYLPLQLKADDITLLPASPGVYYFHDSKDKIIYVGKAVNLKKRVVSHFSNNSISRRKQEFIRKISRVSYRQCTTPLIASLMESIEIKKHWPPYNYSQKKWAFNYGLYSYEDQNGVIRLAIEYKRKQLHPLFTFPTLMEGHQVLRNLIREFNLCPKHSFLQSDPGTCVGLSEQYCHGVCASREAPSAYNQRVRQALDELTTRMPTFALLEEGVEDQDRTVVLMEKGAFVAMGELPQSMEINDREQLKTLLTTYHDNELIRTLVLREAKAHPEKVRALA